MTFCFRENNILELCMAKNRIAPILDKRKADTSLWLL